MMLLRRQSDRVEKELMTQRELNLLWRLNRLAIRLGWPVPGLGCTADTFEEVIEFRGRTWHRRTGTLKWDPMLPLAGNLRT
jgi:hypothetical protein